MNRRTAFASLLLLSSSFLPAAALAQEIADAPAAAAGSDTLVAEGESGGQPVEISGPGAGNEDGGEIVITGRNIPNVLRSTPEVVSVLSAADIARTGEGDIAGALQRVTGLSVVGGRFVYVRGLGERYSLALLNGSPLPSPEPLRRVVPLDIFPTGIIASSVVQKSYSVAYPGEFGGGVINLTTKSQVDEPFLTVGVSASGDTETTFRRAYGYYGSGTDWTGFDDGTRTLPAGFRDALGSGKLIAVGPNFTRTQLQDLTAGLSNAPTTLIQRFDAPANAGLSLTGGTNFDLGANELSVLFAASWSNGWETRGGVQQVAAGITPVGGEDTLQPDVDYRFFSTENRILVNGLLGFGLKFGEHQLKWTNLFIRDTLKEARIQQGTNQINVGSDLVNISNTAWFARQLIDTQFVGEFDFGRVDADIRGTYAQSRRDAPYERTIGYRYDDAAKDFVNDLRSNGQFARVSFSNLVDNVYSVAGDLSYDIPGPDITLSVGGAYLKNDRAATRRDFRYTPLDILPGQVPQERPDYLLSDFNIYTYNIVLTDISGTAGAARYEADLEVKAGYIQAEAEFIPGLRLQTGVRYESGRQQVTPVDIFGSGGADISASRIKEDYFLPAATLTWTVADNMQLRLHGSKTIARPQFRELAPQQYSDPETDRTFFGNQYLTDSELLNAEARWEWYFARDQRLSVAAFWKKIDRPIETVAFQQGGTFFTTFANAPSATLKGVELEAQKYVGLGSLGAGFFSPRRLVLIGNYTWSESAIKVRDGDTTIPVGTGGIPVPAANVFDNGTPLTGQSKHLVNLQIGLENTDRLSQQTLLLTYSSRRVTNRGPGDQPDIFEEPGLRLDFVMREGIRLFGVDGELKLEARNLTGEDYEDFQTLNGSRVDTNSYALGRSFSLGLEVKF
ncbi:MAG TPA: TonB-dependent receptor [Allosphingosinicella sp.]|jgi:outer membrane receptor protein involved in Fe transport